MKCLDDCHNYALDTFMGGASSLLSFYRMAPDGTKSDGVTNEELLRVLIHRLQFLNEKWMEGKFKCRENSLDKIFCFCRMLIWAKNGTGKNPKTN